MNPELFAKMEAYLTEQAGIMWSNDDYGGKGVKAKRLDPNFANIQ